MADDSTQVKFGANVGQLVEGMGQLKQSVSDSLQQVNSSLDKLNETARKTNDQASRSFKELQKSVSESFKSVSESVQASLEHVAGAFESVQNKMKKGLELVAVGFAFGEAIHETIGWAKDVKELSESMGLTAGEASKLNTALHIVGISTEAYGEMSMKLMRQVKANEAALKELGLATRDAQGHLRPLTTLMTDAVKVMEEYRAGSDRDVVAQFMFGRSAQQAYDLLLLNNKVMREAADLAQKLGLVMGAEGVEHTIEYRETVNKLKLEFDALEIALGEAILPAIQEFTSWIADKGVVVVQTFRLAMEALKLSVTTNKEVWSDLLGVLKAVGTAIMAIFQNIATEFQGILMAVQAIMEGQIQKARNIMDEVGQIMHYRWNAALDDLESSWGSFWQRLIALSHTAAKSLAVPSPGTDKPVGEPGEKTAPADLSKIGKGGGKSSSSSDLLAQYQEEMARIKDSQSDLNAWSTQKEYEFWNQKLAITQQGSALWWQIWHKMAEEYRTMTQEQQKQLEEQHKQAEQAAKAAAAITRQNQQTTIKLEEEKINQLYSLGQISASQRYSMLKEQYDKFHALELQAYQDELATLETRKAKTIEEETSIAQKKLEIMQQIEKANSQHLLKMRQDGNAYTNEIKTKWEGYASEVGSALTGLLTKHTTMLQTMQTLTERALNAVINGVLKKLVDSWIAGEAAKTTATTVGAATRSAAEAAGASDGIVAQAAAALKSIESSAATAFAGIFGFLSPVMGPAAAGPAAAGEGVVLSMQAMVQASAAQGWWEVPGEVRTLLHPQEMVLPAGPAHALRTLIGDGGTVGEAQRRSQTLHMHINATDAASFEKQLGRSNSELNRLIKRMIRDGKIPFRR